MQADKLLSQEFQPVIEQLIGLLPADRQIMLFSATFPVTVKQFKDKFLRKPYIVNLMSELTLKGISQVSGVQIFDQSDMKPVAVSSADSAHSCLDAGCCLILLMFKKLLLAVHSICKRSKLDA